MVADKRRQVTGGLDLGAHLGWAIVRGAELLACGMHHFKSKHMVERCSLMHNFIQEHLLDASLELVRVGVEQPPYVKRQYVNRRGEMAEGGNLRTYGILHQYLGVASAVLQNANVGVLPINALTLKKWATGNGHARKVQVQAAMTELAGQPKLLTGASDIADAVACAYYVNAQLDPEYWATVTEWRR